MGYTDGERPGKSDRTGKQSTHKGSRKISNHVVTLRCPALSGDNRRRQWYRNAEAGAMWQVLGASGERASDEGSGQEGGAGDAG